MPKPDIEQLAETIDRESARLQKGVYLAKARVKLAMKRHTSLYKAYISLASAKGKHEGFQHALTLIGA